MSVAIALLFGHGDQASSAPLQELTLAGVGATTGFGIGVVASLMGVAGGELLIPAIILLFGVDV